MKRHDSTKFMYSKQTVKFEPESFNDSSKLSPEKLEYSIKEEGGDDDKSYISRDTKEYTLNGRTFSAQLFNDFPSVTEKATSSFTVISDCIYSTKLMGSSGQEEIMTCDCHSNWDGDVNNACDEDSDCINRLTSIECRNDHCTCGKDCQNQRFQKRQYADIDVILTEKKGFGLRARQDIPAGSFIYEYVGEVIGEDAWRKRRVAYEKQGIKHFYFMMLQKGEFIDATKKANISRFANHSCRPNCVVEKWVVKDKLRMGLFSSRKVFKGEEITFDYNVDRYGAEAQPCYCGESNCIGVLGGKTQTEAANKLPQLLVDALGLDDVDEDNWITVTAGKKKRGKKGQSAEELDTEYAANLPVKPIGEDSVSKVMSSLLQVQEEWLIIKLIERIHITNDPAVDLQVLRMHGYQIFSTILKQWRSNEQITACILEILSRWPKMSKNKISSSQIESTVKELAVQGDSVIVSELSKSLLKEWGELKMAYRIPRREKVQKSETPDEDRVSAAEASVVSPAAPPAAPRNMILSSGVGAATPTSKNTGSERSTPVSNGSSKKAIKNENRRLPPGWKSEIAPNGKTYYFNEDRTLTTWDWPGSEAVKALEREKKEALKQNLDRVKLQENVLKIIAAASKPLDNLIPSEPEASETATPKSKSNSNGSSTDKHSEKKERSSSSSGSSKTGERKPDKKTASTRHHSGSQSVDRLLTKTFAKYVPNVISRYEKEVGHEAVKTISREIVHILVEKEMKSGHEVKNPSELTDHRKARVKKFIKDYMVKVLDKVQAKREAKRTEKLRATSVGEASPLKESTAATASTSSLVDSSVDNTPEPPTKKQKVTQEADIDLGDDDDFEF